MAEDGEILRQIWYGNIPVAFCLADNEIATLQRPDPYYVMVPRLSYFPLVMDKVIKHLVRFVADANHSAADLWLDCDGTPLKGHYPIGLLWDLHGCDSTLPWNVTVHFQDFPEEELIRCNTRASIESLFMSAVKEADVLKHRSQVMFAMQKKDHNQLWLGVQNDKFDQFWAINRKLMERCNDQGSNDYFRHIPFRLYQSDVTMIQRLIKPINESGVRTTLRDLICLTLGVNDDLSKYKIVIHGIEPSLETPLQWMSEHMSYADNFLHICVFPKK